VIYQGVREQKPVRDVRRSDMADCQL